MRSLFTDKPFFQTDTCIDCPKQWIYSPSLPKRLPQQPIVRRHCRYKSFGIHFYNIPSKMRNSKMRNDNCCHRYCCCYDEKKKACVAWPWPWASLALLSSWQEVWALSDDYCCHRWNDWMILRRWMILRSCCRIHTIHSCSYYQPRRCFHRHG